MKHNAQAGRHRTRRRTPRLEAPAAWRTTSVYQSLLQFLYRAPIGLVQTDQAGKIEMINPISARLLMPLSHDGGLDNLFTALQDVAPQLRQLAAGAADPGGMICEGLRIPIPARIGPAEIHCGASIGIVRRDNATGDADAVLQEASLAMAEAEHGGGGRYVLFDQAMYARATQRSELETDLRRALSEGQLFVVYQPVVGLQGPHSATGVVDRSAGVEALVRWRHPTRGMLSPDAFIGMAEESGLIGALGAFVLRTACGQFVAWQTQLGHAAPHTIAVNLSRGQIGQAGLVALVDSIIRSSGIPPARLQVEVTESMAAQSPAVQSCLHELKALGVTLALDDFGTGYSSLSNLDRFPVDTIKIDRSFVTDAPTSTHRRALVDAAVRVAHALNMTTVAEGIETEAQAKVIRDRGCDKGQGYLFSKPPEAAELVRWLTQR